MKLKINKACDLNSISVLPPHSRRPNGIPSGSDSSIFGRSQQPLRSQGMSSQLSQLMLSSQLSQNSIDNNEQSQRFGSQERENSAKRISCLAPASYAREETQTQMPNSRSSNNYKPRWGSLPPPATDHHRCQVSDELEHRIGQIENTQNRQGMIIESIQSDVIQVKKQMQECAMDIESIKQKLGGHESSLQLVLKGEEDIKANLDASLKSLPDQLRMEVRQEIASAILTLQSQSEEQMLKLTAELSGAFTSSVKAITSVWQTSEYRESVPTPLKLKERDCQTTQSQNVEPAMNSAVLPQKVYTRKRKPENKAETRQSSRLKPDSIANTHRTKMNIPEEIPLVDLDEEWRENNELDEEFNGGFAYLLGKKDTGVRSSYFDVNQVDADLMLKKSRRRNRKHGNVIILN